MYSNISVLYTLYKNTLLSLCHNFKSAFFHYQYLFYKLNNTLVSSTISSFVWWLTTNLPICITLHVIKTVWYFRLKLQVQMGKKPISTLWRTCVLDIWNLLLGKLDYIQKNVDFGCAPLISGNKENRYQMYNSCSGGKHFKFKVISLYNCLTLANQT